MGSFQVYYDWFKSYLWTVINFYFSVGRLLRALAESDPKPNTENYSVKEAISEGDMVAKNTIEKLFENQILQLRDKKGIIIDGYPRDIEQIRDFEKKVSH